MPKEKIDQTTMETQTPRTGTEGDRTAEEDRAGLPAALHRVHRTLLELLTGVLFLGLLLVVLGGIFAPKPGQWILSILLGILLAAACILHQYRSLDKALDLEAEAAQKRIYSSYLVRYFSLAAVLILTCLTDVFSPVVVFVGLISWKLTAYLQPLTHKLYNHLFHESDPVPVTEEEYQASLAAGSREKASGEEGGSTHKEAASESGEQVLQ